MASVILVHGIRSTSSMWRAQSRLLSAAGVEHLAVDLPGHGGRSAQEFSLRRCREVIDEATASLPGPHIMVGLSLGSYLLIDWAGDSAARAANGPAALVLASCGTVPRGPGIAGYIALARLIGRLPDGGLRLHTRLARAALSPQAAADLLADDVPLAAMVPALHAVSHLDLEQLLSRITAPVWFVNGTLDHFRLQEQRLLRATPAGTLVHIPRASHLVALDAPERFHEIVMDVVATV